MKRILVLAFLLLCWSNKAGAARLTMVEAQSSPRIATVSIELDEPLIPNIRFIPQEQCWQMDFIGADVRETIEAKAFSTGPLRLVQMTKMCHDPVIQRIALFVRSSVDMKLVKKDGAYQVILKRAGNPTDREDFADDRRRSQPLLAPVLERDEIILDLHRTSTFPLIAELARQAAIDLKFRDLPPAKISITTRCRDPFSALEQVCREMNMVMTKETDGWWLTKKTNPLLQFPGDEEVDLMALHGMTTRDALKQVCGREWYSRLEKQWPTPLLEQKLCSVNKKASVRSWMDGLIRSHGMSQKLASIGE